MEVRLINVLRSGDYEEAEDIIDNLFDINFKSRNIGFETGRYFIIDMLSTLMKVINNIQAQSDDKFISMDVLVENIRNCATIYSMEQEIKSIVKDICKLIEKNHKGSGEKLIDEVIEYIQENYSENWLGLSSIADQFNVTPQYLSSLFKKCRGENLKDYISKIRVEKAKELLESTDLTITEIAERLGYANDMGITRIFKKHEGITPGTYREQVRP